VERPDEVIYLGLHAGAFVNARVHPIEAVDARRFVRP
jgi:hypothetical protein